ncbi:MAG: 3'(2'),5'-bisphosphate nucleotidase CysQ [Hyphomicrobium sp.]
MSDALQHRLAEALFPAAMRAGAEMMRVFNGERIVDSKADGSPVTAADLIAEEIVLEALSKIAPGVPVVAEESASAGIMPKTEDVFFLVDPLDGTREFAAGRPEFTLNIALIENRRPVFGLIYAPALSQLLWTTSGTDAFQAVAAPGTATAFNALARQRLATRARPAGGLTIVASRSHGSEALEAWLHNVEVAERTNTGSSLKFCLVAEGKADLYPRFGPTKEWDTAAGHAIAEAAGAIVTGTDGGPFVYGKVGDDYLNPGFIVWGRPETAAAHAETARRMEALKA